MNVVLVNSTHKWGGEKTWCIETGRYLLDSGHDVTIFGRGGKFGEKAMEQGIPFVTFSFGFDFNPVAIARFMAFFRKRRTDLVIVNVGKDVCTAAVAAGLLGLPVVQRIGADGDLHDSFKTRLLHRLIKPVYMTCSHFVKKAMLKNLSFVKDYEIEVFYPCKKPLPAPRSGRNDPLTFITTSQLFPDKGHAQLLKAYAILKNANPDFRAIILGTGAEQENLKKMALELGLNGHIHWAGFQTDVYSWLMKADVFVLPSLEEPLGQSLQEAMSVGIAAIAREVGGIPEIWPEGLEEYLIPNAAGAQGFAAAMEKVLALDETELASVQRKFLKKCIDTFSFEVHAPLEAAWLEGFADQGNNARPHAGL